MTVSSRAARAAGMTIARLGPKTRRSRQAIAGPPRCRWSATRWKPESARGFRSRRRRRRTPGPAATCSDIGKGGVELGSMSVDRCRKRSTSQRPVKVKHDAAERTQAEVQIKGRQDDAVPVRSSTVRTQPAQCIGGGARKAEIKKTKITQQDEDDGKHPVAGRLRSCACKLGPSSARQRWVTRCQSC